MHIVVIRFSSLGDIILQTPLISWLKSQFSDLKITFITSSEFESLVASHPHIDKTLLFNRSKGLKDISNLIKISSIIQNELKADMILDLHGTLRARLIKIFSFRIPSMSVDKRSFLRFLLIRFKINFLKKLESHHERVINDFKFAFGREFNRDELEASLQEQTHNQYVELTTTPLSFTQEQGANLIAQPYIVISPVASFLQKRWPIENFKKLIELILAHDKYANERVVIIAGPEDKYCERLDISNERFINLQGRTSLLESNQIVSKASVCITNDTGIGHIAEASGVSTLVIFGPTSEDFGFKPHLKTSSSISVDIGCRPCSGTGSKECYKEVQECMLLISPQMVLDKLLLLDQKER